jgi:hypothetical protein
MQDLALRLQLLELQAQEPQSKLDLKQNVEETAENNVWCTCEHQNNTVKNSDI